MVEDLIVSCCTEVNNSVADECHMNPDVKKWMSMSKGSDNFASLRGRRSKGKGKGISARDQAQERRNEGNACKEAIVFAIPPAN